MRGDRRARRKMGRGGEGHRRTSRWRGTKGRNDPRALQDAARGSEIAKVGRILARNSEDSVRKDGQENHPQTLLGGSGPGGALSLKKEWRTRKIIDRDSGGPISLRFYEFPNLVEYRRPRHEWCAGSRKKAARSRKVSRLWSWRPTR